MKKFLAALICLGPCLAQQTQTTPAQTNSAGMIMGSLTGNDGTTIVGGYVTLQLRSPIPTKSPSQTHWAVVSGAGGSFQFGRLPQGTYEICAQVLGSAWLNPCEWGLQPPVVVLSSTQPLGTVTMVLAGGAVVPIRVNDPAQLLPQNEGKTPGAQLLIGIANDGGVFRPAPVISQDAAGRNQQIVIPFGHPVNVSVYSSFFQLAGANGIALPRTGASIPVGASLGQQPAAITLLVTGGGS